MTIFHRLQGYLVTYIKYFLFLFTLVKFGIYPCDVTDSCITNLHTNLGHLGLAKITVTQDGTWFLFFKKPVNLNQYSGTVGLFNSSSIVNRFKRL